MEIEEYYAAARALGLRPTHIPGVWLDRDDQTRNVPDPEGLNFKNRRHTIERLRELADP